MSLDSQAIIDRLASVPMSTGLFDKVNTHEPKNKPGRGHTCAIWVDRIEPARGRSGLAATSARVVFNVRIYTNMLQDPQDAIDPAMVAVADKLFESYSADFDLGGTDRWIDLLGATQGHELYCQSGYINIDNMTFRVLTLTVPVIVENAWSQSA